jgi:hypothetical protein
VQLGEPGGHMKAQREAICRHAGGCQLSGCTTLVALGWRQYLLEDYGGQMLVSRQTLPAAYS